LCRHREEKTDRQHQGETSVLISSPAMASPPSPAHASVSKPHAASPAQDAAQLYRAHASFIAAFVRRMGVAEHDVEDQVQEVFVIAFRKGGYRPGLGSPRTWLGQIALNLTRNARQKTRRRRTQADEEAVAAAVLDAPTAFDLAAASEALVRVQRALEELDFDHRVVFVLREIAGLSFDEVAQTLSIPVGTVHSRLHHARDRFRAAHDRLTNVSSGEAT
jgi:RNA polymerase sigma-70 factor, ECF subfamily